MEYFSKYNDLVMSKNLGIRVNSKEISYEEFQIYSLIYSETNKEISNGR